MKVNDAPRIIIQLILSALVFFVFSFKYKSQLIGVLSEQVYYQLLIITVILTGYFSRWIDELRICLCHHFMMFFNKKYKVKYLKDNATVLLKQAENANISDEAKAMVSEMTSSDFELEGKIKSLSEEISRIKK
ncbi:hypothetical protein [Klebsiella sp. JN_Kp120]|uniref:hypothetical protein n=1 Tax=unclassified Klebsiella TaxID=2608929 RepID=UPI0032B607E0